MIGPGKLGFSPEQRICQITNKTANATRGRIIFLEYNKKSKGFRRSGFLEVVILAIIMRSPIYKIAIIRDLDSSLSILRKGEIEQIKVMKSPDQELFRKLNTHDEVRIVKTNS